MTYVLCYSSLTNSCENIVLWRGHFNATENTQSVNFSINGGEGRFKRVKGTWILIMSISFRCHCLGERRILEHVIRKVSHHHGYDLRVLLTRAT